MSDFKLISYGILMSISQNWGLDIPTSDQENDYDNDDDGGGSVTTDRMFAEKFVKNDSL